MEETQVQSLSWEDPLEKEIPAHSSILIWKSRRQRSLACYSSWGHKELDMTRRLSNNKYFIVYIYIPQLLYPFIFQWTFRVLPCLGYCKWCCNECCTYLFELIFSGYIPRSGIAESHGNYFYPIINPNITVNLQLNK